MTIKQKLIFLTVLILGVGLGTGSYQAIRGARIQRELRLIKQEELPTTVSGSLRQQYRAATNQLAGVLTEIEQVRLQTSDIHKLRGEVARLRTEVTQEKASGEMFGTFVVATALNEWTELVTKLEQWIHERPEKKIPEFKYLTDEDWLDVAKTHDTSDEKGFRDAAAGLRQRAAQKFAAHLHRALNKYMEAHGEELPPTVSDLKSYFDHPVDAVALDRYRMEKSGKYSAGKPEPLLIAEKAPVDNDNLRCIITRRYWSSRNWNKVDPAR